MKISVVGHNSKMIPLLLQWCQGPDSETRVAALAFLLEVVNVSWPRLRQAGMLLSNTIANSPDVTSATEQERSLRTTLSSLLVSSANDHISKCADSPDRVYG